MVQLPSQFKFPNNVVIPTFTELAMATIGYQRGL